MAEFPNIPLAPEDLIRVSRETDGSGNPSAINYATLSGQIAGVNPAVDPAVAGGQAGATQLGYGYSMVNDTGGASDLQLPPAKAGTAVILIPTGSHATQSLIWAKNGTTDTINGQVNATAFDVLGPNYSPGLFICAEDGAWLSNAVVD